MTHPADNNKPRNPDKPPRRRWPRWARITRAIAIAAALLILAGFFAAPPIAKNILEKQLSKNLSTPQITRTARIERVRINPLALSCVIEGLSITTAGQEQAPLVGWRRLQASLDLRTLVTREWRLRRIALDGFSARITVRPDGKPDFNDLLSPAAQQTPPAQTPPAHSPPQPQGKSRPLRINQLTVTDAHIDYTDASLPQPFETRLGPVSFTARDFQTGGPDRAPGEFSATTESGETLAWRGNLAVAPLLSTGEIRIENLSVKKYTPFYTRLVRFDVLDGKIDITINYEISTAAGRLDAHASQSAITLRDISLAERGQSTPAIAIETIALSGISAEAGAAQSLRIENVALDNGALALRRDAHGINLAQLLTPATQPAATALPPGTAAPTESHEPSTVNREPETVNPGGSATTAAPDITIDQLTVRNLAIDIEDATLETPMHARTSIDTLSAKNFSLSKLDTPLALELTAHADAGGTLRAAGELALSPLRGKISAELANAPLSLARDHINQLLHARIDAGLLTTNAAIAIDPDAGITATGETTITGLVVTDATGAPVQSLKTLALRGITLATQPAAKIAITEIALDGADTQVTISPDGTLNIATLTRQTEPPSPPPETTSGATAPTANREPRTVNPAAPHPIATIGKVTLTNSRVTFADNSIAPPVKMSLDEISGAISGLSSENLARADVDLHAKINAVAPVSLTGQINPLSDDVFTDLRFTITNAALAPLGPYVGKYAGRALASGALNVDVTTKVAQHLLDSSNLITLDQFQFGERTNSPDATSLPVGLAVSLLRDRSGKIVLDVPVKGSLNDPDFKYGRAVWRAIGNLLVKAATAPFSLLAAALGGGGGQAGAPADAAATDLSRAEFDAGSGAPNETARKKLDLLATALRERPALHLAIAGGFDPEGDRAALRNRQLVNQLKQEHLAELAAEPGAQATPAAAQTELAPGDEPRLVERLYRRKFPTIEQTVAATPSAPTAATPPAPGTAPLPSPGDMRARLLGTIPVNDEQLRQLAAERAESVRNYLVGEGVEAPRIALAASSATGALASLELQ